MKAVIWTKLKVRQCFGLFGIRFRQFSDYRQPELGNLDLIIHQLNQAYTMSETKLTQEKT